MAHYAEADVEVIFVNNQTIGPAPFGYALEAGPSLRKIRKIIHTSIETMLPLKLRRNIETTSR